MIHVIVTSSRTWRNPTLVYRALHAARRASKDGKVKVTHGDCPTGGDHYASIWADACVSAINDPHPADWDTHGKRAGPIRNEEMVDLGPQFALAFVNPCAKPNCPDGGDSSDEHDSHGAAHTIGLCEFEKIPIEVFREKSDGKYWSPTSPTDEQVVPGKDESATDQVVDLFAGPGGWDVGARWLGLDPLGVENDTAACKTREAAGLRTLQSDIRTVEPMPATGLIASPPCQSFSAAGKGSGRKNLDQVFILARLLVLGEDWRKLTEGLDDERTALVLEPLHWAYEMFKADTPYRWLALEQVPPVLPVWEFYAEILRSWGYSVATAHLQAEMYGVPQTRKRAILIASLDHEVSMPTPTHSKYYPRDPQRVDEGVDKWVSMAEALGWGMNGRPSTTLMTGNNGGGPDPMSGGSGSRAVHAREQVEGRWIDRDTEVVGFPRLADGNDVVELDGVQYRSRDLRPVDLPAQHVTEKVRSWRRWPVAMRQSAQTRATVRDEDQPAPTITAAHDRNERVWLVNNTSEKAGVRESDEPAPTMYFGERLNKAVWTHERPATTITTTRRSSEGGLVGYSLDELWPDRRPATTVNGDPRISKPGHHDENTSGSQQAGAVRVTIQEAAILQSFPQGYPWQGSKTRQYSQIGNAIPCRLAYHILKAVTRDGNPDTI
jgi:DNA (cytosine-5)-methyltransferase 1